MWTFSFHKVENPTVGLRSFEETSAIQAKSFFIKQGFPLSRERKSFYNENGCWRKRFSVWKNI